ncbi:MAG: hypothetical protein PSY12_14595 [bacterium]|nr:hypothetical protein [bacterium]
MNRAPLHIAILGFDRPQYLEQVLQSLVGQLQADDKVFFFQDGGWNPHSGRKAADEAPIETCVALVSRYIPHAAIFRSSVNLGIAGNYRRAEQYVFQVLGADSAVFLEDDMVLSEHYLAVIAQLLTIAAAEPAIGYVSGYGDMWATVDEQVARVSKLIPMHENWGAALTRSSWIKQRPIRELYWSMVRDVDYRFRNHARISGTYGDMGYRNRISSQDASRWIACVENGLVRLTTGTCQARYIGEVGEHFRAARFHKYRFDASQFYPDMPQIIPPTAREIANWRRQDRQAMVGGYRHSYVVNAEREELGVLDADGLIKWAQTAVDTQDDLAAEAAFSLGTKKFADARDSYDQPLFQKAYLRFLGDRQEWARIDEVIAKESFNAANVWRAIIVARAYASASRSAQAQYWWRCVLDHEPDQQEALAWLSANA